MWSATGDRFGCFSLWRNGKDMHIIASDGTGWREEGLPGIAWEHVSVSMSNRTPSWDDMCAVKDLFWRDDEAVMQLHPAKINYVNFHKHCLHLWAPIGIDIPVPPSLTVGPKEDAT